MQEMTYEKAIKRLEEIVNQLEEGNISLEKSMELFEEGTKLGDFCSKSLSIAEQKVIKLSEIAKGSDENGV